MGLVVIEYRSQAGEAGDSLPISRGLSAYRRAMPSGGELQRDIGTAAISTKQAVAGRDG